MMGLFRKHLWKWHVIAFFLVVIIGVMVLVNPKETVNADNNEDAVILSKNTIDYNKDLRNEELLVKMTDGRHYEEKEPGPFMGANWEGRFVLQLLDDKGNVISQLDLNQAFGGETLKFQYSFDIEFEDYNHDDSMDFTIGQYASSNGNIYRLFTITPDGGIEPLKIKSQTEIFSSGGGRYSIKFEKRGLYTLINRYYDNSRGEMMEAYYPWSEKEKQYVKKPGPEDMPRVEVQDKSNRNQGTDSKNWEVVSRSKRVQGAVVDLDLTSEILYSITLKVTKNIQLPNDPIDNSGLVGQTINIVFDEELSKAVSMRDKLEKGLQMVVTYAQYAVPPEGKVVLGSYLDSDTYYEQNGKIYNLEGEEVDLVFLFDAKPQKEIQIQFDTDVKNEEDVIAIKPVQTIKAGPEFMEWAIKEKEESKKLATGLFDTILDITQGDDSVELDLSLKNISEEDLKFYFSSGQRFDIFITGHEGEEVYRWSHDKCFTMAIIDIDLKKGEKLSFLEAWDYFDNEGSRVPPGKYSITVKLLAKLKNGKTISPDELTAVKNIEVK